jgi:hypothetical protein
MRKFIPLLKASIVGAAAFSLPWIRISQLTSSIRTAIGLFVAYGFFIAILTMVAGFPFILIAKKLKMIRWWFFTSAGFVLGAALGGILTFGGLSAYREVHNPFALTFSPLNRNSPGFIDDIPLSLMDFVGSIGLGAFVGASIGLSVWYFYSHPPRVSSI